jgi:hypothetical protein
LKWKRRSPSLPSAAASPHTADELLVAEMHEWIRRRAASVDRELRNRASRDGVSDPVDADAIAARIAATTELPLTGADYLGFANIVAQGGDDNPLLRMTVTWQLADGSEATAPLTEVLSGIRRLQPQLFDVLVEVQRLRNERLEESADDYVAVERSRRPADDGSLRAVNAAVGRLVAGGTLERYLVDAAVRKLGNDTTPA